MEASEPMKTMSSSEVSHSTCAQTPHPSVKCSQCEECTEVVHRPHIRGLATSGLEGGGGGGSKGRAREGSGVGLAHPTWG